MSNKAAVLAKYPNATALPCGCGCGFTFIYAGTRYLGGWWSAAQAWRRAAENFGLMGSKS